VLYAPGTTDEGAEDHEAHLRRLVGVVGRADVLGVLLRTDRTQSGAALRGRG
jgi:hypothetical protein